MEEAEAAEVGVLPAAEAPLGLHPAHIPTVPVLCSFPLQRSCNLQQPCHTISVVSAPATNLQSLHSTV